MTRISLVDEAHKAVRKILKSGDCAVDATVGNGHDTAFLARQVGPDGRVFGFDIQKKALEITRQRLQQNHSLNQVQLFQANHVQLRALIPGRFHGRIQAIMFNLGYLPGGDKTVITRTESTLAALEDSLKILSPEGLLSVLAYPGHPGGDRESENVLDWIRRLDSNHYNATRFDNEQQSYNAPRLFLIEPKSS